MLADAKKRCPWPSHDDEVMLRYHDEEWGVPVHEEKKWFEYIVLDAFQAGLSWKTILYKRKGFRQVFHNFDPTRVAHLSSRDIDAACKNPAIIRNRSKIKAAVNNAKAFLDVQDKHGSFDTFIWSFTNHQVIHNTWTDLSQLPVSTPLSDKVSITLKQIGFSFVGSTICYAFLQAAGVVNDHLVSCYRYDALRNS